jgi:hypothetical protein
VSHGLPHSSIPCEELERQISIESYTVGLVGCASQKLKPYDMRLGTGHRTSPPIHQWGARVKAQLDVELAGLENVTLIALAGEQYRSAVYSSRWPVEIPMKGLGIGQQLGWLTEKLSADGQRPRTASI